MENVERSHHKSQVKTPQVRRRRENSIDSRTAADVWQGFSEMGVPIKPILKSPAKSFGTLMATGSFMMYSLWYSRSNNDLSFCDENWLHFHGQTLCNLLKTRCSDFEIPKVRDNYASKSYFRTWGVSLVNHLNPKFDESNSPFCSLKISP